MKDQKVLSDFNGRRTPSIRPQTATKESLPLLVRSGDGNDGIDDDIKEIEDLQSIESGSKLALNDMKNDADEVIQELNKLISETEEKELVISSHFRRRGQSWSNWDNNVNVELKAEVSLNSIIFRVLFRVVLTIQSCLKHWSFKLSELKLLLDLVY